LRLAASPTAAVVAAAAGCCCKAELGSVAASEMKAQECTGQSKENAAAAADPAGKDCNVLFVVADGSGSGPAAAAAAAAVASASLVSSPMPGAPLHVSASALQLGWCGLISAVPMCCSRQGDLIIPCCCLCS